MDEKDDISIDKSIVTYYITGMIDKKWDEPPMAFQKINKWQQLSQKLSKGKTQLSDFQQQKLKLALKKFEFEGGIEFSSKKILGQYQIDTGACHETIGDYPNGNKRVINLVTGEETVLSNENIKPREHNVRGQMLKMDIGDIQKQAEGVEDSVDDWGEELKYLVNEIKKLYLIDVMNDEKNVMEKVESHQLLTTEDFDVILGYLRRELPILKDKSEKIPEVFNLLSDIVPQVTEKKIEARICELIKRFPFNCSLRCTSTTDPNDWLRRFLVLLELVDQNDTDVLLNEDNQSERTILKLFFSQMYKKLFAIYQEAIKIPPHSHRWFDSKGKETTPPKTLKRFRSIEVGSVIVETQNIENLQLRDSNSLREIIVTCTTFFPSQIGKFLNEVPAHCHYFLKRKKEKEYEKYRFPVEVKIGGVDIDDSTKSNKSFFSFIEMETEELKLWELNKFEEEMKKKVELRKVPEHCHYLHGIGGGKKKYCKFINGQKGIGSVTDNIFLTDNQKCTKEKS